MSRNNTFTNQRAQQYYEALNKNRPNVVPLVWKSVSAVELYVYIGVLISAGDNHSNFESTIKMWKPNSYPLYRATFSFHRFRNIARFIRFDNSQTRSERLKTNKAAPITDVWTMLNDNLYKFYRPTENLTIYEHLLPYRGRTKFTQYIPVNWLSTVKIEKQG